MIHLGYQENLPSPRGKLSPGKLPPKNCPHQEICTPPPENCLPPYENCPQEICTPPIKDLLYIYLSHVYALFLIYINNVDNNNNKTAPHPPNAHPQGICPPIKDLSKAVVIGATIIL